MNKLMTHASSFEKFGVILLRLLPYIVGVCGNAAEYCGPACQSQWNADDYPGNGTAAVGVNYGRLGNDLPSHDEVVQLLQSRGVKNVKIYDAVGDVIQAFANSGIALSVSIPNEDVAKFASNEGAADIWVRNNIQAYYPSTEISSIAVGNEYLRDGSNDASKLLPAMKNVQRSLEASGLTSIKVSTFHSFESMMGNSYPPSEGAFADKYVTVMRSVLEFLRQKDSVFMLSLYPFVAYRFNSSQVSLDYALFKPNAPILYDSGRHYRNLFDAQVDSVISALNRLGYGNLPLVITTGWPSRGGGMGISIENAKTYNNNLVKHVLGNVGTPLRPGVNIPTYIFALFNENQKWGDFTERHFGLFYPDQNPVYDIQLSLHQQHNSKLEQGVPTKPALKRILSV